MKHATMTLDDKYAVDIEQVYLTGTQALVRLPLLQRQLDRQAGLNTACFISGYRGSPLGAVDIQLWQANAHLQAQNIHFQPGLNEEAGATAVWGSQQVTLFPGAKHDGVFAFWYGKGPGVDRSGDVFKHANFAGSAPHGGVLLIAGDDHACKSSTVPNHSEQAFVAASVPVLVPGSVQDILELGLHGWAMSRYSGLYTGFKTVADVVDSSASVSFDVHRFAVAYPNGDKQAPGGLGIRLHDAPLEQEIRIHQFGLPAAQAYVRENRLDRILRADPGARFGIITAGKSTGDVHQALADLGLAGDSGIRILKLALTWPVDPVIVRQFAHGLDEILIVEEKVKLIETQVKEILYGDRSAPAVLGKQDESGAWLIKPTGELSALEIAGAIGGRLLRARDDAALRARVDGLHGLAERLAATRPGVERKPYYCSGCPHNISTKVIDGSRAMAGIGCHYMVTWMDRQTDVFSQMGGEGMAWIGQAPFTEEKHVFANIGDGTYYHSGILAIRAAVASGTNITYKLLFNDAVAMTGGQPVDGPLTVPQITRQLAAEGVRLIFVVTDEPEKYAGVTDLAPGVEVRGRDRMQETERTLRDTAGCTALVYDQTCASEKRRRRKRGTLVDPAKRAFINTRVCEGCGDCSQTSNCLSVVPVETTYGQKRAIDQSSCNKDFSCIEGFCPSFVTVHGGTPRRPVKQPAVAAFSTLPEPVLPDLHHPFGLLVAGVGGTGVVTIGALLGVAAHAEGKHVTVLDQLGMAQKGGSVWSHVKIARRAEDLHALKVGRAAADLLLACDLVVGAGKEGLGAIARGVTQAVVNTHEAITAAFITTPGSRLPVGQMSAAIAQAAGPDHTDLLDATAIATALAGDAIATNLFMLGYAWQRGFLPIGHDALMRAIEMNGTAVESNKDAFRWGRCMAVDGPAVRRLAGLPDLAAPPATAPVMSLDALIADRAEELRRYQNRAYGVRYRTLLGRVRAAEALLTPDSTALTTAVARSYFKLLAYKDEFEVARLYASREFRDSLAQAFEGDVRLEFHMAPPRIAKRDPATGHLKKQSFGSWMLPALRVLRRFKFLRGTRLDPFDSQGDRDLIAGYEATLNEILGTITPETLPTAVALAALPERVAGYGHVKERAIRLVEKDRERLLAAYRAPALKAVA